MFQFLWLSLRSTENDIMATALGIVSYIFSGFSLLTSNAPVVEISSGKVQGRLAISRGGRHYYEYLGKGPVNLSRPDKVSFFSNLM